MSTAGILEQQTWCSKEEGRKMKSKPQQNKTVHYVTYPKKGIFFCLKDYFNHHRMT